MHPFMTLDDEAIFLGGFIHVRRKRLTVHPNHD
nr:MAG TPA: hypothetical protein [Caudoviricetes sp.]